MTEETTTAATNQTTVKVESNTLGTAGFVTSLVGWVTCGVLCPIGLVLSAIALFKRPRGMAIAGTIIGALGTAFVAFIATVGIGTVAAMFGFASLIGVAMEQQATLTQASSEVRTFYQAEGRMPSDSEFDALMMAEGIDYEGTAPRLISTDGTDFTVALPGSDGQFGTDDDNEYSSSATGSRPTVEPETEPESEGDQGDTP